MAGAKQMLGVLTVAALIHGLPALPHNEVALSEFRRVTQDSVLEQSRAELFSLTQRLLTLQEKKAEEEGELEVLQAQEKQLTEQVQRLSKEASRKKPKGPLSFLQVNPSKEAESVAELALLRAQRHAREAQESAALAKYAYEKLAKSRDVAVETAGDAALEDVIKDARQDASDAVKILRGSEGEHAQALKPGLSFLQEATDAHHAALERVQASLAKMQSSTKMSREQLRQTTKELLDVENQIATLQRQQATMKKEASNKEKLLVETHQILAGPVAAEADAMGLPGSFTQLSSQEKARSTGKSGAQKLAIAEQALTRQKATLEQKRRELAKVQTEIQEVQQAAAQLRDGDVAKVKKQNVALLETLRSTSHTDKAERQQAEAESKRLMSTTASKEQQLSRERQELASQQAEVAALREENQKKHSQEKQKNIEVNRQSILLQKAEEQLHSTQEEVSSLKRLEAQSTFELTVIKEEQLGTATGQLHLEDLKAARKMRQERVEVLEKLVDAESKNISDLSFALEQEKSRPELQELRKKATEAAKVFKDKASVDKKTIGLLQQQVAQQTSQLRANFRSKSVAAQANRQNALMAVEAKLEKETREELATLEAKNRSLSHQLVLLQQEDEAQVEVLRHKATARALQKELDQVKSEEAQLLDKAAKTAFDMEARLEEKQKSLEQDLQQKEQSILNLQQHRLEDGERIQAMQQEMAEASLKEKKLAAELRQTQEQRARLVSTEEVELTHAAQRLRKAQQEEEKRQDEEIQGLKRELEAEKAKNDLRRSRKAAQLEREIQQLPRAEDGEISQLAGLLEEKESKLQKVREFLTSEGRLSSAAKAELKNLREHLQQAS